MYVGGGFLNWGYPLESWLIKGLIPYIAFFQVSEWYDSPRFIPIPTVVSSLRCHQHFVSRGNPMNSIFRLGKYHPSVLRSRVGLIVYSVTHVGEWSLIHC